MKEGRRKGGEGLNSSMAMPVLEGTILQPEGTTILFYLFFYSLLFLLFEIFFCYCWKILFFSFLL